MKFEDRTIFVDLDDTVADFRSAAEKILAKQLPPNCRGITDDEWRCIEEDRRFYFDLEIVDGGELMMSTIQTILFQRNMIGCFLSAIPANIQDKDRVCYAKSKWVNKRFPYMRTIYVPTSKDKIKFCEDGSILIDDKPDLVEAWNLKGGIGILLHNCYDVNEKLKKMFDI